MKNIDFTDFFNVFLSGATIRANTLTQFACPGFPVQEKEPPRQGEHACGSSRAPAFRCRKKESPR